MVRARRPGTATDRAATLGTVTLPTVDEVRASLTAPGQPFEMDEVVIRGITIRVWKHAPPTLRAVLDAARSHGERDFIAYVDVRSDAPADAERHAFDRHWRDVMHLAAMLRDRFGVVKGDRVAIAMRNLPEWSTAFFAATAVGAVAVPLNAWWTGAELRFGLVDSGAAVLFCDEPRYASLATELNELPDLRTVVVTDRRPRSTAAAPAESSPTRT